MASANGLATRPHLHWLPLLIFALACLAMLAIAWGIVAFGWPAEGPATATVTPAIDAAAMGVGV